MGTIRMVDGTTGYRCAECGAPVAEKHAIGGCLCDQCWDAILDAEVVDLVDDAGPACDHCGKPCDPQAEGCTVYCSVQCYAAEHAARDAAVAHHTGLIDMDGADGVLERINEQQRQADVIRRQSYARGWDRA